MAEIEELFRARLAAHAGTAALVVARIYPKRLPQPPVYPALVYQRVGGTREWGMTQDHGLAMARIQVDCYATSYSGALALATQVKSAFGVGGARYADLTTSPQFLDVLLENELDWPAEDEVSGAELDVHRRMLDFTAWYREG